MKDRPQDSYSHEDSHEKSKKLRSSWLPVSAFLATSLAIAIPLFIIKRQRNHLLKESLKGTSSSPPPRQTLKPFSSSSPGPMLLAPAPAPTSAFKHIKSDSPGTGELLSAMSSVTPSTALYAGKAFAIATCIVTFGGVSMAWAVKTALGIKDAKDFGDRMRTAIGSRVSHLSARIHRPPESGDESRSVYTIAPLGMEEDWTWEEAEKRLKKAYDEGGFTLWATVALREMEAEARLKRTSGRHDNEKESKYT